MPEVRQRLLWASLALVCLLVSACELPPPQAGGPSDSTIVRPPPVDSGGTPAPAPPDTSTNPAPAPDPVRLPIEVIGPADGVVESRTLNVPDTAGVTHLYLQVHRAAYLDQQKNPDRRAKASVKVGSGDWVDLVNGNVRLAQREKENGGIGGGPHTVRMAVPVDSLAPGPIDVRLRFNGTDGITSGFRVIDMNFLRAPQLEDGSLGDPMRGQFVLGTDAFEQEDPEHWMAPEGYMSPDSVAEGRDLWYNAKLVESLDLGLDQEPIKATCSGCHIDDGSDLSMFAYSNHSIQVRSEFHGLSESEGRKIAAYIRSLDSTHMLPKGRPWNPPYQPGEGLDAQPQADWAAGAGIDAVLDEDSLMRPHLFPNGINTSAVDYASEINVREQPIAIEMPDWNAWLPRVHPVDIWGDYFLSTDEINPPWRDDIVALYERARDGLANEGPEALAARNELGRFLYQFGGSARLWFLHMGGGLARRPDHVSAEEAKRNIRTWGAVKLFGMHQEHELYEMGPEVYEGEAEARTWLTQRARAVFDIAPHLSADNDGNFAWQTLQTGKYRSTSWYQLQMILNAGNNSGINTQPVDWNYQPIHIKDQGLYGGSWQPFRQTQTFIKMLQQYSTDDGLEDFYVRQIHPGHYAPEGKMSGPFDQMQDEALRADLYEVLISSLMDKIESHSREEWIWKQYEGEQRDRLRDSTYVPRTRNDVPLGRVLQEHDWVDGWYTVIPRFRRAGVSEKQLTRMIDWAETMWPRGDWDRLR